MKTKFVFRVGGELDPERFSRELAREYRGRGYSVNVSEMSGSFIISFEKKTGRLETALGLREGIKATFMYGGGLLCVSFSDAEWAAKIAAILGGFLFLLVPSVTGAVGALRQASLPGRIARDTEELLAGGADGSL